MLSEMARARWGTGSITARGAGTWRIRLSLGVDPVTGQRRVLSETVHGLKRDAQRRLDELVREHGDVQVPTTATVATLASEWLQLLSVRPQTEAGYRRAVTRDLVPLLGAARLDKLTPLDVQRAYKQAETAGWGVHRIRLMHAVLSKMLNDAVRWGWVPRNVAANVPLPALPARQDRALDAGEVGKLVTAAGRMRPSVAVWLHLHLATGARRSEILALRWSDIDLVGGRILFSRTLERRDGVIVARPGSKTGRMKVVPVGAATVQILTEHLERGVAVLGEDLPADAYVLSFEPDGSAPWQPDYASHLFGDLAAAAGVSGVRLHDLRHTAISHIIASTGDLLLASRIAGHSRTATTGDVYGHLLPGQFDAATESLGRLAAGDHTADG